MSNATLRHEHRHVHDVGEAVLVTHFHSHTHVHRSYMTTDAVLHPNHHRHDAGHDLAAARLAIRAAATPRKRGGTE